MGNIPHSPQKKALQISVAPFLIFVSPKNIEFEPECKSRGMETGLHSRGAASVALSEAAKSDSGFIKGA